MRVLYIYLIVIAINSMNLISQRLQVFIRRLVAYVPRANHLLDLAGYLVVSAKSDEQHTSNFLNFEGRSFTLYGI